MCGIVAVLARPSLRPPPDPAEVAATLSFVSRTLGTLAAGPSFAGQLEALRAASEALSGLDASLRGVPGLCCLLGAPDAAQALTSGTAGIEAQVADFEAALDKGYVELSTAQLEELNAALVVLHDATWALSHDRLDAVKSVSALAGRLGVTANGSLPGAAALGVLWAAHVTFRSLDRLEVRGRDSAGLHLMLAGHGLDLSDPSVLALIGERDDPLFSSMAVRAADGCLSIVYKAAAEIGELGDNVAALRQAVSTDALLARALASPDVRATLVAHTRWASVGLISEPNAHPLNSDEVGGEGPCPYVIGALNGDVDNHAELVVSEHLAVQAEVTTDAKLVPTLVARYIAAGLAPGEAFREAVGRFDGSVGIAANASRLPDELYLALRGSGQSLNIGLAEDAFIVASEPYGLVEETSRYVRMDGEGGGQVVTC
ncbi:MAG TPA: glucosamine-6-phosphate synthase, partial [Acidimicrobiales bacterium]|nr:glucosamine-6-phosphate synthase [Acidimicrobiales bacterium]